MINSQVSTG